MAFLRRLRHACAFQRALLPPPLPASAPFFPTRLLSHTCTPQPHPHALPGLRRSFAADTQPSPLQQAPPPLPPAAFAGGPPRTAQATLSGIRMSPKKLSVVARLVRGLACDEAVAQCALLPKRGARLIEETLASARANAVANHGLDDARLRVAEAFVTKGSYLRRIMYHARGKTGVVHRPRSHLTVVVAEAPPAVRVGRRESVARGGQGEVPAWQKHQERRRAKAVRVAAGLPVGGRNARRPPV